MRKNNNIMLGKESPGAEHGPKDLCSWANEEV
jgi:hypothetical protein